MISSRISIGGLETKGIDCSSDDVDKGKIFSAPQKALLSSFKGSRNKVDGNAECDGNSAVVAKSSRISKSPL